MNITLAVSLGAVWGLVWAAALQFSGMGQYLALKRAWLCVVIGVGVDLLIMGLVVDLTTWLVLWGIVAASSIGIIGRSLWNEWAEQLRMLEAWRDGDEDEGAEQGPMGL